MNTFSSLLLGLLVAIGLALAGYGVGQGFVEARGLDRSVEVKGLAEREVVADTAIWPLQFVVAGDDLDELVGRIESQREAVTAFLVARGFTAEEISVSAPSVVDRLAQAYSDPNVRLRYSVSQVVTVFSGRIDAVRGAARELLELGKAGVVLNQENFEFRTQYLFNGLNEIKPAMIEEATRNGREVAAKFAADSESRVGKLKAARQGQFTIEDRDSNNPHVKKVRVVSTLEYYLVDGGRAAGSPGALHARTSSPSRRQTTSSGSSIRYSRSYLRTGSSRMRVPVAAKIAFARAGAIPGVPGSPAPPTAPPLATMCVSITGVSSIRTIG